MFIDAEFLRAEKLHTRPLPCAIPVYNIDGTPNELGSIKEEVELICTYGDHTEHATFLVTSLGSLSIILGHTWLVKHNPDVNWHTGQVKMTQCPESCGVKPIDRRPSVETVPEDEGGYNTTPDLHTRATVNEGDRTFVTFVDFGSEAIGASSTVSQQLA